MLGGSECERLHRWSHQVRMLAQAMQWETQLAAVMVPQAAYSRAVESILSTTAKNTIETGYALAGGRVGPERLFPLLDAIACMHDPHVLPLMKQAFKEEPLQHLKAKFHDLLGHQYEQAQHCVESFSASVASNIVLKKEVGQMVTVANQTAFVLRFLKVRSLVQRSSMPSLPYKSRCKFWQSDIVGPPVAVASMQWLGWDLGSRKLYRSHPRSLLLRCTSVTTMQILLLLLPFGSLLGFPRSLHHGASLPTWHGLSRTYTPLHPPSYLCGSSCCCQ